MKKYIIGTFLIAAFALTGCNSNQKKTEEQPSAKTEHTEGDGHDHEAEGHTESDGHDHGNKEKEDTHADEIVFTKDQAKAAGMEVYLVKPGTFSNVIKTSGQIEAAQGDEATIVATSNGVVSFSNQTITAGAPVSAGSTIVTISAKNLSDGDPTAKAKIAYETALKEYKRSEGLVKDKIISAKEFEQARFRYETAKTAYEAQASNVTAAGVRITSPISGYITNRLVSQGEYVSIGQPIATVSQNRRLQLRAEVAESYFNQLKSINNANFVTSYDNQVYKLTDLNGRLLSTGKASGNTSFYIPVTFEFDNMGDIIPGSFVEVYLLSSPQNNLFSIPLTALTEEQGVYFVYVQIGEEEFKKKEVQLGQSNGESVRILSGLTTGEKVVSKGAYQVKLAASSSIVPEGHSH